MAPDYKVVHHGKWLEMLQTGTYEFFHRHNKPKAVVIFAQPPLRHAQRFKSDAN